nr:hypothetical protein [uncultured Dialister sp.]
MKSDNDLISASLEREISKKGTRCCWMLSVQASSGPAQSSDSERKEKTMGGDIILWGMISAEAVPLPSFHKYCKRNNCKGNNTGEVTKKEHLSVLLLQW